MMVPRTMVSSQDVVSAILPVTGQRSYGMVFTQ
jgi:hypothetical protein